MTAKRERERRQRWRADRPRTVAVGIGIGAMVAAGLTMFAAFVAGSMLMVVSS